MKTLYPFAEVKQGAEGVNFTAITSILAIPLVLGGWLIWASGGLQGVFGSQPEYVIPTAQIHVAEDVSFDAFAMFEQDTATPAAGRLITSVPSSTPTPTEWVFPESYFTARGCNPEGVDWIVSCELNVPYTPDLPTPYPTPYFITVTPTMADGHSVEAYLGA